MRKTMTRISLKIAPLVFYSVTNGNCLWQLQFPDVIGFLDNGCHRSTPSPSLPPSSLNTAAPVPQGHAIQSDWRRDEAPAELMYSTCLLFIMARRGFSGKLTSVPQTPSLVNEVTSHTKYTIIEGIISELITHKPGIYSH